MSGKETKRERRESLHHWLVSQQQQPSQDPPPPPPPLDQSKLFSDNLTLEDRLSLDWNFTTKTNGSASTAGGVNNNTSSASSAASGSLKRPTGSKGKPSAAADAAATTAAASASASTKAAAAPDVTTSFNMDLFNSSPLMASSTATASSSPAASPLATNNTLSSPNHSPRTKKLKSPKSPSSPASPGGAAQVIKRRSLLDVDGSPMDPPSKTTAISIKDDASSTLTRQRERGASNTISRAYPPVVNPIEKEIEDHPVPPARTTSSALVANAGALGTIERDGAVDTLKPLLDPYK
ncbi:hypothetical protein HDU97_001608, partial [Phlyctochytrium planicorne]